MAVVSITRLRLRSMRFLPGFVRHTWSSTRQLRSAGGFVEGRFATELPYAYWTMTVWTDLAAMHRFRDTGAHRVAMRKLLDWCDEAGFVHWESDEARVPAIAEAHERLATSGRTSKVRHPSPAHIAGKAASSRVPLAGPALAPQPR
jgi:hypothetical protein